MTTADTSGHLFGINAGGDLRSLGQNAAVVAAVHTQEEFDLLFRLIFHHQRRIAMRSIDAVEKITRKHPEYLASHKQQLMALMDDDPSIEMKWHLAQIITRVELSPAEFKKIWARLTHWAVNPNESKIVRVNSLQPLFDLIGKAGQTLMPSFRKTVSTIERERIPSITARIRKLRKKYRAAHNHVQDHAGD